MPDATTLQLLLTTYCPLGYLQLFHRSGFFPISTKARTGVASVNWARETMFVRTILHRG